MRVGIRNGLMICLLTVCCLTGHWLVQAQMPAASQPVTTQPAATQPGSGGHALPGIAVNHPLRYIEIDGRICLDQGPLELIATGKGGKTHEAIVELDARIQHIHFALLLLGLRPGHPGMFVQDKSGRVRKVQAKGDQVRLMLVYSDPKTGASLIKPIQEFVVDGSGKQLSDNVFIFAGSKLKRERSGKVVYVAEREGNAVSLVSFGDEMLAWPVPASDATETLIWSANPKALPPVNARVRLRIQAAGAVKPSSK